MTFDNVVARYNRLEIPFSAVLHWCESHGIDYWACFKDPAVDTLAWQTKSKPTAPGWWRASVSPKTRSKSARLVEQQRRESEQSKNRFEYRYWDGTYWSRAATCQTKPTDRCVMRALQGRQDIEWKEQRAPWETVGH